MSCFPDDICSKTGTNKQTMSSRPKRKRTKPDRLENDILQEKVYNKYGRSKRTKVNNDDDASDFVKSASVVANPPSI